MAKEPRPAGPNAQARQLWVKMDKVTCVTCETKDMDVSRSIDGIPASCILALAAHSQEYTQASHIRQ